MAPVIPSSPLDRIEYFESIQGVWQANAAALGLVPADVAALITATTNARQAYEDALTARNASRAATANYYNLAQEMFDLGAEIVKTIKRRAESTDDPNIYVIANIPAPAPASPAPPPEAPMNITAAPNADGTVTLRWQGTTAHRTHFTVWRRRSTDPQWTMIGSCSRKSFIDDTVPAPGSGTSTLPMTLLYHVRAQRGSFISMPSMTVTVTYGSDGSAVAGTIGASVGNDGELSIAA